jgi:thymidylate synthase (FAD)
MGHEAVIEHFNISVKFICDRGVTHELVRHRIASYAQESTRYVNYSKGKYGSEITVIEPLFFNKGTDAYKTWQSSCEFAEKSYLLLLELDRSPQEARSVLPNSLKTEIVVTMNLRELRHFFKLRTAKTAHPQMREVAIMLLNELKIKIPVIFDDIEVNE